MKTYLEVYIGKAVKEESSLTLVSFGNGFWLFNYFFVIEKKITYIQNYTKLKKK